MRSSSAMPRAPRSAAMAARSPRCAPTISPRLPIKALVARNPKADWSRLDEVFFGCANQAGEDNRNVARMALLLAGLPDSIPGVTRQPAVRLGARRGRRRGPRDPRRRDRFRHRRRRRIDDARAVRDGQGRRGVLALGGDLRHHDRLALHQSADEGAIRRRFDGRDRRERRRGIPSLARRPGRLRAALAAARRQGRARPAISPKRSSPVEVPGGKAGPIIVDKDEHPRPETTLEKLAKLKPIVRNPGTVTAGNASGVNDGAAAIILASEDAAKAHGLTPRARILGMASAGGAAADHGHRPGAVDQQADGAARPEDRRLRSDRDQRSLRLAGARLPAPARRRRRCRARQSARRRHRARPSARHVAARGWR